MTNPRTGGDTTDTSGCEHSSGVTLVFLLLLGLVGISRSTGRCVVVMAAVSVSVAEETALVMTSSCNVRSVGARRSVGAGRQIRRRVPLGATCGLLHIAVLRQHVQYLVKSE